jgi:hypothetical protein
MPPVVDMGAYEAQTFTLNAIKAGSGRYQLDLWRLERGPHRR